MYYYKNPNLAPISFIDFKGLMHIYNNTKKGERSVEKIEKGKKI